MGFRFHATASTAAADTSMCGHDGLSWRWGTTGRRPGLLHNPIAAVSNWDREEHEEQRPERNAHSSLPTAAKHGPVL
jgi:hypothetical protein